MNDTHANRRESLRLHTRMHVRGIGADRHMTDCLGDVAVRGVGFSFPRLPETDDFQIFFSLPGDAHVRRSRARVIDVSPLPGTCDRESPWFVHLRFTRLAYDAQWLLRQCVEQHTREALYDFDIDEAEHSLIPAPSSVILPAPRPAEPRTRPQGGDTDPARWATVGAARARRPRLAHRDLGQNSRGFFSRCLWSYLKHDTRRKA